MQVFYKIISKGYDLLDVIYFRNFKKSPRKAVLDRIYENEKILDVCTGTATNVITIAKEKTNAKIIGIDLSKAVQPVQYSRLRRIRSRDEGRCRHRLFP